MRWFSGGIAEAITNAKSKGAIFVVYIEGKDEQSRRITDLIDNGELGQKLEREYYVAIKIEAGSVPHQQFGEIFKAPSVPSVYFIGKTGVPLDIITGGDNLENVSKKLEDILSKAGISETGSDATLSNHLIQNEQATVASNIVCEENGTCSIRKNAPDNTTASTSAIDSETKELATKELSPEEKLQRAQDLLEEKRVQKEREEKENERLKEIERRKMGQNVQQMKKWQEDQELKQLKEDRDREKRENQMAREKVLAQIAQDKAERLLKSQNQSPSETAKSSLGQPSSKSNSNTTRLQFKLPDGSSEMQEFASSDSLDMVISYVKANMKLPFAKFTLSTTFPRREFTIGDYSQSLLDLQLTPNAVVLILPINNGTVSTNPVGSVNAIFWSLFAPVLSIFQFIKNFIFGTNPNATGNKRTSEASSESRSSNPKRKMRDSTVVKREGNVHRLSDKTDSDDDGNTWNGNSTQQM